jgi:hypothetical protein
MQMTDRCDCKHWCDVFSGGERFNGELFHQKLGELLSVLEKEIELHASIVKNSTVEMYGAEESKAMLHNWLREEEEILTVLKRTRQEMMRAGALYDSLR